MKTLRPFLNRYPLSKTLRFELRPIGKTRKNFYESDILREDERRAAVYPAVKKLIDMYHRWYISEQLSKLQLPVSSSNLPSLQEYYELYTASSKDDKADAAFDTVKKNLRKRISDHLTSSDVYKRLFGKELIQKDLLTIIDNEEERAMVAEFDSFTTYFTGFYESRKNIYSAEDHSTAISYRLIHENLPKFIDNMRTFLAVSLTPIKENYSTLYTIFKDRIGTFHLEEVFTLPYYNHLLTQEQIETYNAIIGGYTEEGGIKIQGLNEYINLYNQTLINRKEKLPKLKPLFKQILSERITLSWLPEKFSADKDLLSSIQEYYNELYIVVFGDPSSHSISLKQLLSQLSDYDLERIFLTNDLSLTDVSQAHFGDWGVINRAISMDIESQNPRKKNETSEKYEERKAQIQKKIKNFSIGHLNRIVKVYLADRQEELKPIEQYFASSASFDNLFFCKANVDDLFSRDLDEPTDLIHDAENIERIKKLLDAIKGLQRFVSALIGGKENPNKDERFYSEFFVCWEQLSLITPLYDKVRNYLTRKPYSDEKIKLNFGSPTLLNGWDKNKEDTNLCVLLRRDGNYYLAIMSKKHNRAFLSIPQNSEEEASYEKIDYKLLPGPNKMLPKVFFSKSRIDEFKPDEDLLVNYQNETHKKGDLFDINHCHRLIDFFKKSISIHPEWKEFGFSFSETKSYKDMSEFYREVGHQGYKITYRNVPADYIDQLVDEGKLYLFQIYNKDFSPHSKGTPNLHTLYWKMLFDADNLKDVVYKLNGEAELFYRKGSVKPERQVIHPANQPIKNKNPLNQTSHRTLPYDVVKDKRYTEDHFLFHVPITMNFKAVGRGNINLDVNQFIRNTPNLPYVIGIDRGERHLLYLSLIDPEGKIVEQYSLNEIVNTHQGETYRTDYMRLLSEREKGRDEARKNWKTIDTIKELKEGYLSQVVHKIVELMVRYQAIVVLEDLNSGFKRGRQKIERQVYQKFEKMLIEKLNYLVDKKSDPAALGGLLHAYQLTSKFESFAKLGRQTGFLFYIPAWNTSKIDPVTGFVNSFDARYESIDKSKSFFEKFEQIRFNTQRGWYEFQVESYNLFSSKVEGTRQQWTLCTYGERIETFCNNLNKWDSREIDLTHAFSELWKDYEINPEENLKLAISRQNSKKFFDRLLGLFRLMVQLRNSHSNTDIDYMISPVADQNGVFFDSRQRVAELPLDADANGAYNIARKGLMIAQKIRQSDDLIKCKLTVTNKEWLQEAQKCQLK